MVVVCQQPNYFAWLGYLEQCARSDVLILLDSVQWIKQGRQHRTRILAHTQEHQEKLYHWLTLPVLGRAHRTKTFCELEIDRNQAWAKWHWNSLKTVYGKRPFFKSQLKPIVQPWFEKNAFEKNLFDVTASSLKLCLETLGLKPEIIRSSNLDKDSTKTDRLVSLCKAVNGDVYYSGLASTKYIEASKFRASEIELIWQHWKHPDYDQGRFRFQSHLSFLDVLANVPVETVRKWLQPRPWGPPQIR